MKDVVESVDILKIEPFSAQYFSGHAYSPAGELLSLAPSRSEVPEKYSPSTAQFLNTECNFSYRDSIFKKHPEWIILGATLKLQPSNPIESRTKVLEYSKKRIAEETQASGGKGAQEVGAKCAGCIFKNPRPDLAAGFLIDTAGLKGKRIGGAMVSEKHANFIISTGGATAGDIKNLIQFIKAEVQKKHGILLEEEIRII